MKYLNMINFAMTMNLHFINNLMDLKMINESAFEAEIQDFDLVSCMDRVYNLFKKQAETQGVEMNYQVLLNLDWSDNKFMIF